MPSERWLRANRVFEQAVEMAAGERQAFLDQRCAGDADLRAAVERWLRADAAASRFLHQPLIQPPKPPAGSAHGGGQAKQRGEDPPTRLGPYRLLEKIGQGGMGVVYLAVRDDEAFERQVAVKIISHEAVSEEARRRLSLERRILASLDHPWIARIYDGGTTPEGLPYLVMEHVEGVPIDRHCDLNELSVEQRIELFRKVCAAVQASHRNLVVHCDLKPSNILVTAGGDPKLLDFGIAKLLSRERSCTADEPVTLWPRPLTPQYASPEQVRGEALSTVSDVYSLGVLLYKLLTGRRPHDPENLSPGETERTLEQEPTRPSVAAAGASAPLAELARRLGGDLDAIVLKALRGSPGDRYGSAEQLSADPGRYLEGFPVRARRGSLRYRAGKLLRRHRVPVVAAAAVLALLIAFAGSMTVMAGRLAREQVKLSREKTRLQEVAGFVLRIFRTAGPVGEYPQLSLRDAVDRNTGLIEGSFADQPEIKAAVLAVLGEIYLDFGEVEQALSWSEQALEIYAETYGVDSLEYAGSLDTAGAALRELDRLDEAEAKGRAALDWFRAHPAADPDRMVRSLNNLVNLQCRRGGFAAAEADSAVALRLATLHLGETSLETAAATVQRAVVLRNTGKNAEAEATYARALELYRGVQGPEHPYQATILYNLALIQRDRGDVEKAAASLEAADRQYQSTFGEISSRRVWPLVALAKLAAEHGTFDEMLRHYGEAIRVAIESSASRGLVMLPAYELGGQLLARGDCRDGEDVLRAGLEDIRARSAEYWRYYAVEGQLGECLLRQGRTREAGEYLERSYEKLRETRGNDAPLLHQALDRLIELYRTTRSSDQLAAAVAERTALGSE